MGPPQSSGRWVARLSPATSSRALARPLTRVLPGGSIELGAYIMRTSEPARGEPPRPPHSCEMGVCVSSSHTDCMRAREGRALPQSSRMSYNQPQPLEGGKETIVAALTNKQTNKQHAYGRFAVECIAAALSSMRRQHTLRESVLPRLNYYPARVGRQLVWRLPSPHAHVRVSPGAQRVRLEARGPTSKGAHIVTQEASSDLASLVNQSGKTVQHQPTPVGR